MYAAKLKNSCQMTHSNRDSSRHNEALKNAFAAYLALIFNCTKLMFLSTFYAPPLWRTLRWHGLCVKRERDIIMSSTTAFNGCRAGEKLLIFGCPNEKKGNLKSCSRMTNLHNDPSPTRIFTSIEFSGYNFVIKWRFSILHEHNIWTRHDSEAWMVCIWP